MLTYIAMYFAGSAMLALVVLQVFRRWLPSRESFDRGYLAGYVDGARAAASQATQEEVRRVYPEAVRS